MAPKHTHAHTHMCFHSKWRFYFEEHVFFLFRLLPNRVIVCYRYIVSSSNISNRKRKKKRKIIQITYVIVTSQINQKRKKMTFDPLPTDSDRSRNKCFSYAIRFWWSFLLGFLFYFFPSRRFFPLCWALFSETIVLVV